jgi:1,4-dihydroxy-2-naphthoyl-CoA hydrolase
MTFTHPRTIRFQDTDAAGVVYFANVLSLCHEAYEASLANAGISLRNFFTHPEFAIPIIHANVDFRRPMYCGEQYEIHVKPSQLSASKFEISYSILLLKVPEAVIVRQTAVRQTAVPQTAAQATTVHVCIDPATRDRIDLPAEMIHWLTLG